MKVSLIVCTKNRSEFLRRFLASLDITEQPSYTAEIVIVDNGSEDDTKAVCTQAAHQSRWNIHYTYCAKPGLGNARNHGVEHSRGEILAFTDDDCLLDNHYFLALVAGIEKYRADFGGGQIHHHNPDHDPRMASLRFTQSRKLPKDFHYLPSGTVQGANMFFARHIFNAIGGFNPLMGSGTPFPCEDIEFAARANQAGYNGTMLADLIVHHDHRRSLGSDEADCTALGYKRGKGAYLASLLLRGYPAPFNVWLADFENKEREVFLAGLVAQLRGAADYLETALTVRDDQQ